MSEVRCNWCMNTFDENKILFDEEREVEKCPYCKKIGCLMDMDTQGI